MLRRMGPGHRRRKRRDFPSAQPDGRPDSRQPRCHRGGNVRAHESTRRAL